MVGRYKDIGGPKMYAESEKYNEMQEKWFVENTWQECIFPYIFQEKNVTVFVLTLEICIHFQLYVIQLNIWIHKVNDATTVIPNAILELLAFFPVLLIIQNYELL